MSDVLSQEDAVRLLAKHRDTLAIIHNAAYVGTAAITSSPAITATMEDWEAVLLSIKGTNNAWLTAVLQEVLAEAAPDIQEFVWFWIAYRHAIENLVLQRLDILP